MPLLTVLGGMMAVLLAVGVCVDYFYKKNGQSINSEQLRKNTKTNFGSSSAFM